MVKKSNSRKMLGYAIKRSSPYTQRSVVVPGRQGKPNSWRDKHCPGPEVSWDELVCLCVCPFVPEATVGEQRSRTSAWMDCVWDRSSGGIQDVSVCVCLCVSAWVQGGLYQKLEWGCSMGAQCTFQQLGRWGSRSNYQADQVSELEGSMLHNLYLHIFH